MEKIKQLWVSFVMLFFMVVCVAANGKVARAEEIIAQGNCGAAGNETNVTWKLTSDGVLTVSGTGDMADYENTDGKRAPWYSEKSKIKKIVIEGITTIGSYAFTTLKEKEVVFEGDALVTINEGAFSGNDKLEIMELPSSLKNVGKNAFGFLESWETGGILHLPNLEKVGEGAFSFCRIVLFVPGTLTEISKNSLRLDYGVAIVGEGVKRINEGAFGYAERVELPTTITYMADNCIYYSICTICAHNNMFHEWAYERGARYLDLDKKYDISKYDHYTYFESLNDESKYTGKEIIPTGISFNIAVEDDLCGTAFFTLFNGYDFNYTCENTIKPGYETITIKGKGMFEGSQKVIKHRIYDELLNCNITMEYDSVLYDGKPKTPEITITHAGDELVPGTDYTLEYINNVEEGTATAKITGKAGYDGEIEKKFSIYKYDLSKGEMSLSYSEILYDGTEKTPEVTVKYDGQDLVKDKDYSLKYMSNKESGVARVLAQGLHCYKGAIEKTFSIYKHDITKADVTVEYSEILCDGNVKEPAISVKYNGNTLARDKDYTVEIVNNTLPGTAKIKITGINQYEGIVEKQFEIVGVSIADAEVSLKESIYSYDGSPKTPSVEVKLGDKTLVKDMDYTLTYENNIDDGTAHAVVTGTGIYKDVVKVSFVILPYNAGMDAVYPEGTLIDDDYVYGVTDDETNEVEFFCPANQKIKNVHIPATVTDENGTVYKVTSIGNKAFYKNTKITSVTVGNNVKSIEDYAFYGCKNVTSIKLGANVEMVGNSAFRKCTKLTSVTLPKSLNALGKNAFYGCSKLKTIVINANSVVDVKSNAIKGVSKKCVIKVPKKLVKKYQKEFDKKSGFTGGMKVKKK